MARKRGGDPAFGSDSFLDVLANLVGILIIVIVLVAAQVRRLPSTENLAANSDNPTDSPNAASCETAERELADAQADVAALQQRLLALLQSLDAAAASDQQTTEARERQTAALATARQEEQTLARQLRTEQERLLTGSSLLQRRQADLAALRGRIAQLEQRQRELANVPPDRRLLRYHAPVSRAVGSGELIFELRDNRITFIDLESLLGQVKKAMPEKVQILRSRWELSDSVKPVGAFTLRYTLVRERGSPLEQAFGGLPPAHDTGFAVSVARWEVVPLTERRGETLAEAIAENGRFRTLIESLSPQEAVLTFAVYPESFETFRQLRDLLHEKGFVVAGRPLPSTAPISGSRQGTLSLGQ